MKVCAKMDQHVQNICNGSLLTTSSSVLVITVNVSSIFDIIEDTHTCKYRYINSMCGNHGNSSLNQHSTHGYHGLCVAGQKQTLLVCKNSYT